MLTALIMAGGRGERFWPKSRGYKPKQLLSLYSECTMIEETVNRLNPLVPEHRIFISTSASLEQAVRHVLTKIPAENFIIEPAGRNTAPCIGLAALTIRNRLGNVPFVVLPADHLITDSRLFQQTLSGGAELAVTHGKLVTIGIKPVSAHTGYGYIHQGERLGTLDGIDYYELAAFVEKPDRATATRFLEAGTYLWNSGMFIWTCDTILAEIERHIPALDHLLKKIGPHLGTSRETQMLERHFPEAEHISIDVGVMEKTDKGVLLRGTFAWNDVGNWLALEHIITADSEQNTVRAPFQSIATRNCIVVSDKQLITTIGVSDLVIVSTEDAVLVCHKSECESIKKLVEKMKSDDRYTSYL